MARWLGPADALLQQAAWWAAVLLAAGGRGGLAAAAGFGAAAVHLALRRTDRRAVALVAGAAAAYGLLADTLLVRGGLLGFGGATTAPAFMVGLWAAFGAGLTASLRWLVRWRPAAQAALGAVAGPLAYRAGAALGAMDLGPGVAPALAAVGAAWAVGLPLLCLVARRAARPDRTGAEPAVAGRPWRWRWAR